MKIGIYRTDFVLLKVLVELFQKLAPIQRAQRWSPRARGEITLSLESATEG
jgi:hypothetical protein